MDDIFDYIAVAFSCLAATIWLAFLGGWVWIIGAVVMFGWIHHDYRRKDAKEGSNGQ